MEPSVPRPALPDFRALFDALPGLYLVVLPDDPVFTIVAANRAYAEATLTDPLQIVGRPLFEVFPDNPADPRASGVHNIQESLRHVIATRSAHTLPAQKYDIRTPGGGFEERYWSPVNSPLLDDRGEVQYLIHRVEDVTDLVRERHTGLAARSEQLEAELFLRARQLDEARTLMREREEMQRKLVAMEARYGLAFAQAPIGMVLLSPEGRVLEVNQAYLDSLGFTREELIARDSSSFTHPDDIEPTRNFFVSLREGAGDTATLVKRYFRKDGRILWARASAAMRRDPSGTPVEVIAIVEDITGEVLARKQLEESERQFRSLAETIPHLAWMADETGSVFWYNRRWYEYTGTTLEENRGFGWQKLHDPALLPEVVAAWAHAIASGEPFEMVFPLRGADGRFRSFLTRVEPVLDLEGRAVRWFGTNTDITGQRNTEEELRRMNRELEEFAYVASHDLQEPLRMVNIYTQKILRDLGGDKQQLDQYSRFVEEGVRRMEALIHDLLTFSRTVQLQETPAGVADLSAALHEAMSVLKGRIDDACAVITVSELPPVRGETSQLTHVFQNVLSNALKYRKKDVPPRIDISARCDGAQSIITIRDNGIGFDPQYAERIFGLFKRLHKDEYPGTGLGLAICKRIVERYGGRMWAEGRPGEGTSVHFALTSAGLSSHSGTSSRT